MPGAVTVGFFGKLPARGDFVRAGLPRGFVDAWDGWLQNVLPACRTLPSTEWEEAPAWRFALPAGCCGPEPVQGVLLPSLDRAGRRFPLTLAGLGGDGVDTQFLARAEHVGRSAIADGWAPETLMAHLPGDRGTEGRFPALGLWWTDTRTLALPGLPGVGTFADMLLPAGKEIP